MITYASVSEWNKETAGLDLNAKPSLAFDVHGIKSQLELVFLQNIL